EDFLEARVLAERVPLPAVAQVMQGKAGFVAAITNSAWSSDKALDRRDRPVCFGNLRIDHCQHPAKHGANQSIFCLRRELDRTLPFSYRVLFATEIGVKQSKLGMAE